MNSWNGLDFFIFLIFALNTIVGMQRGASREIIAMMCLSVALIFTIRFTLPLTDFLLSSHQFLNTGSMVESVVDNQFMQNFMTAIGSGPLDENMVREIVYSISLLICFVGIYSICAASLNVAGISEYFSFPYATLSRKVGAALGATRGYILTIILISILNLHLAATGFISGSFFAALFEGAAQKFDSMITSRNPEDYNKLFEDRNKYNATDVIKQLKGSLDTGTDGSLQPAPQDGTLQPAQPATPAQPASSGHPAVPATPAVPAQPSGGNLQD